MRMNKMFQIFHKFDRTCSHDRSPWSNLACVSISFRKLPLFLSWNFLMCPRNASDYRARNWTQATINFLTEQLLLLCINRLVCSQALTNHLLNAEWCSKVFSWVTTSTIWHFLQSEKTTTGTTKFANSTLSKLTTCACKVFHCHVWHEKTLVETTTIVLCI